MTEELFYPQAIEWMWNYCIPLGKFTDSKGNNYDLGIHILEDNINGRPYKEISAAIVCSNNPGDYYSGELKPNRQSEKDGFDWYYEKYNETYKRAKAKGVIKV